MKFLEYQKQRRKRKIENKRRKFFRRLKNGKFKSKYAVLSSKSSLYKSELRVRATEAEKLAESILKDLKVKYHFQKSILTPIHRIFDFFIPSMYLAIEIDGSSHDGKYYKDRAIDKMILETRGIETIRFTNEEVFNGMFREKIIILGIANDYEVNNLAWITQ